MEQRQFAQTMQGFNKRRPQQGKQRMKQKFNTKVEKLDPSVPRNLKFVNLKNDEVNFLSSLKIDLIHLQEQIDQIDIDGLLRSPKVNAFTKKNYVVSMKKFLAGVSPMDSLKELEQRSSMQINPARIKMLLNTEEYPDALAKLYRIVSALELVMLKYTEYEILSFLKYDDSYLQLAKKSGIQQNKLQSIGFGLNIQSFKVALTNLDRLQDLFGIASKVLRKSPKKQFGKPLPQRGLIKPLNLQGIGGNQAKGNTPKKFKTIDEFESFLKSTQTCQLNQDNLKNILQIINYVKRKAIDYKKQYETTNRQLQTQQQILVKKQEKIEKQKQEQEKEQEEQQKENKPEQEQSQIPDKIEQFQQKNLDLKAKIKIAQKDVELWKQNYSDFQQELLSQRGEDKKRPKTIANRDYFLRMLDDYKEAYESRIQVLTNQNIYDKNQLENIQEENELMNSEISAKSKEIEKFEKEIKKLQINNDGNDNTEEYEESLRQEFQKMQTDYQEKIKSYEDSLQTQRRAKNKRISELRRELKELESNKGFILKKLELYSKKSQAKKQG